MWTLLSHHGNANGLGCDSAVEDFPVLRIHCENALGGRGQRVVVDIFWCGEAVSDLLKMPFQLSLVDGGRKVWRAAEKQSFVFVQLNVGKESEVRPKLGDACANIFFDRALNL